MAYIIGAIILIWVIRLFLQEKDDSQADARWAKHLKEEGKKRYLRESENYKTRSINARPNHRWTDDELRNLGADARLYASAIEADREVERHRQNTEFQERCREETRRRNLMEPTPSYLVCREYPYCRNKQTATCPKCGNWYCAQHISDHLSYDRLPPHKCA